jgi:dTDP-4-amino-4,6-dideoxygalactose transaminase
MSNITHAPLPSWKYLVKMLLSNPTNSKLSKPWQQDNEKCFWFSRSSWSLYAIALYRIQKSNKKNILIWLPGYFCNSTLAPLREIGVNFQFYPLRSDGKPDIEICEKMLKSNPPDIIIFVHYFGKTFYSKDLVHLAKNNNSWLVEDCAHCLKPEKGIGNTGDFVLYSQHKSLSLPDGALMLIRNNGPSNLININFGDLYRSLSTTNFLSFYYSFKWLAKRILQKLGVRFFSVNTDFFNDNKEINSECTSNPKMSYLARKLLMQIIPDLDMEMKARKRNALQWKLSLEKHPCAIIGSLFISENHTPYLAGFKVASKQQAEKIFHCLQDSNIPVTTWPDLPHEVLSNALIHKVSIKMQHTTLFFPVHSSIDSKKIMKALVCSQ